MEITKVPEKFENQYDSSRKVHKQYLDANVTIEITLLIRCELGILRMWHKDIT